MLRCVLCTMTITHCYKRMDNDIIFRFNYIKLTIKILLNIRQLIIIYIKYSRI